MAAMIAAKPGFLRSYPYHDSALALLSGTPSASTNTLHSLRLLAPKATTACVAGLWRGAVLVTVWSNVTYSRMAACAMVCMCTP
jgi:hypothetical protein